MPSNTPVVNPQHAQQFLTLLRGDKVFIRAVNRKVTKSWHGPWNADLEIWLGEQNQEQFNIYYAVNECGLRGPKLDPATHLRAIYADDDNTATPEQRERFSEFCLTFPPHITVSTSPGKFQYAWLTEPLPLELQPVAGRNMATWFGMDRSVIDWQRVLRLPAYRNWSRDRNGELKYPEGPLATWLQTYFGPRRTEAEVRKAFGIGDHAVPGNQLHTIGRIETSERSYGLPETFGRAPREPLTDADPAQGAIIALHGRVPGTVDSGIDERLIADVRVWRIDEVLDVLALIDPDEAGDVWRRTIWGFKEASGAAPWAHELMDLWSSLAEQDWGQAPIDDVWKRGTPQTDWRAVMRLSAHCKMPLARRLELRSALDAFKRSSTCLPTVEIKGVLPKFQDTSKDGTLKKSDKNFDVLCALGGCDPRMDTFRKAIVSHGDPVDEGYLQRLAGLGQPFNLSVGKQHVASYVQARAWTQTFDSARDWLRSLEWDGEERTPTVLHDWLGCENNPYNQTIFPLWLMAAVRRQWLPGCKFDNILILKGRQGAGKSSFFRLLSQGMFNDSMSFNVTPKEIEEQTRGVLIVEIPELAGLGKREVEHVKKFLSTGTDIGRAAYAVDVSSTPRRFVIGGTANQRDILRDSTGNRRYWLAEVSRELTFELDCAAFAKIVPQLWAEAVVKEQFVGSLALPRDLLAPAEAVHARFRDTTPAQDTIMDAVGGINGWVSFEHLYCAAGYQDKTKRNPQLKADVSAILLEHGWEKCRQRLPTLERPWGWFKVDAPSEARIYELEGSRLKATTKVFVEQKGG